MPLQTCKKTDEKIITTFLRETVCVKVCV